MIESGAREGRAAPRARSIRSTARRAGRPPRCSRDSTRSSSICRTSARASTRTSTRWRTRLRRPPNTAFPVIVCDRPNPIGGTRVEGPMLDAGFESFVGHVPDSDAPRHDDRRTGAALQRALRHRREARSRRDARLVEARCTATRRACPGCCRRRTCRRSTARSCIRARCCSRARTSRRAAARRSRSNSSARRGSIRSRSRTALNAARACRASTSGRASSNRRFTSTPRSACGGCQIHVTDRHAFRPVADGRRAHRGVPRGVTRRVSPGVIRPTNTNTRDRRSTSFMDRRGCAKVSNAGNRPADLVGTWDRDFGAVSPIARTIPALHVSDRDSRTPWHDRRTRVALASGTRSALRAESRHRGAAGGGASSASSRPTRSARGGRPPAR